MSNNNNPLEIVEGPFALISTGNCTVGWVIDTDNIAQHVHERRDHSYGLRVKGHNVMLDLYTSRDAADAAMQRAQA